LIGLKNSRDQYQRPKTKTAEFRSRSVSWTTRLISTQSAALNAVSFVNVNGHKNWEVQYVVRANGICWQLQISLC